MRDAAFLDSERIRSAGQAGVSAEIRIADEQGHEVPPGTPGEILAADRSGIVVACGTGAMRILELQREGGRRMTAQEFLTGHPLAAGTRFCSGQNSPHAK